jgi:hypothetical protein
VAAVAGEFLLVAVATALEIVTGHGGGDRYALIVPLALALGLQNATVRALAVPDMTTTVLTLTLAGLPRTHASPAARTPAGSGEPDRSRSCSPARSSARRSSSTATWARHSHRSSF